MGDNGISIITPEDEKLLFTVVFQNEEIVSKNVLTFMIASSERLSSYLFKAIQTTGN